MIKFVETLCGRLINVDLIMIIREIEGHYFIFISPESNYEISKDVYIKIKSKLSIYDY